MPEHLIISRDVMRRSHNWMADNQFVQNTLPIDIASWLSDTGSLTSALKGIADGTFEVNLLSQKVGLPFWHEQQKLGRPLHAAAIIREVELLLYGEAVVFARSIIPMQLAGQGAAGLANLGGTPLGHLLFKDGRMRVSKRQFLRVLSSGAETFARRTPYDYRGSQILVSEFFLPHFNKYLAN